MELDPAVAKRIEGKNYEHKLTLDQHIDSVSGTLAQLCGEIDRLLQRAPRIG